jgi:hypothetical protein
MKLNPAERTFTIDLPQDSWVIVCLVVKEELEREREALVRYKGLKDSERVKSGLDSIKRLESALIALDWHI